MVLLILLVIGIFLYFIGFSNIESKNNKPTCKIHKWEYINGILVCNECNYAPALEEGMGKKFDDLD